MIQESDEAMCERTSEHSTGIIIDSAAMMHATNENETGCRYYHT
jgi:hypothetical protein